jgi:hypothetical protein
MAHSQYFDLELRQFRTLKVLGVGLAAFGKSRRPELSDRRFLRNKKSYGAVDRFQGMGLPEGERNIMSPSVDSYVLLKITNSDVKPAPLIT